MLFYPQIDYWPLNQKKGRWRFNRNVAVPPLHGIYIGTVVAVVAVITSPMIDVLKEVKWELLLFTFCCPPPVKGPQAGGGEPPEDESRRRPRRRRRRRHWRSCWCPGWPSSRPSPSLPLPKTERRRLISLPPALSLSLSLSLPLPLALTELPLATANCGAIRPLERQKKFQEFVGGERNHYAAERKGLSSLKATYLPEQYTRRCEQWL